MSELVQATIGEYRKLVAIRYLNASEKLMTAMKAELGFHDFHILVTLRSFIEYTRKGIWFLVWAKDPALRKCETISFRDPGTPSLERVDQLIQQELGNGKKSPLSAQVKGVNESFIHLLHALTHGNPFSVRLDPMGLNQIFDIDHILMRCEQDLNLFRMLLYSTILGDSIENTWSQLVSVQNSPAGLQGLVIATALRLKTSGHMNPSLSKD